MLVLRALSFILPIKKQTKKGQRDDNYIGTSVDSSPIAGFSLNSFKGHYPAVLKSRWGFWGPTQSTLKGEGLIIRAIKGNP